MTDEAKALVAHFRAIAEWLDPEIDMIEEQDVLQSADLIETQAREIARLREVLGFAMRTLEAEGFSDDGPTLIRIRAALAGDSHDQ